MKRFLFIIICLIPVLTVAQSPPDVLVEGKKIPRTATMSDADYVNKINETISRLNSTSMEKMTNEEAMRRFNYSGHAASVRNFYNPNKGLYYNQVIKEIRLFDKKLIVKNDTYGATSTALSYSSDYTGTVEIGVLQDKHILDKITYDKASPVIDLRLDFSGLYVPKNNFFLYVREGDHAIINGPFRKRPSNSIGVNTALESDYNIYPTTPASIPTALAESLEHYFATTSLTPEYANYANEYLGFAQQYPQFPYYIRRRFLREAERNGFQVFFEEGYPFAVVVKRKNKEK